MEAITSLYFVCEQPRDFMWNYSSVKMCTNVDKCVVLSIIIIFKEPELIAMLYIIVQ